MEMLKFRDVLIIIFTAIIFSFIYKLLWIPYNLIALTGTQLNQFLYGGWFMAATFSMLLIGKPGAAILGEMGAALIESLLAGGVGMQSFIYGILQGTAIEIVFLLFLYKKFNLFVTILAALLTTIFSLIIDNYYGYLELEFWALSLAILFRTIGAIVLAALLVDQLVKMLEQTGVTDLIKPQKKNLNHFDKF